MSYKPESVYARRTESDGGGELSARSGTWKLCIREVTCSLSLY